MARRSDSFSAGQASPAELPTELHWQIVFSGKSAGTQDRIVPSKMATRDDPASDDLIAASTGLSGQRTNLENLASTAALKPSMTPHT